MDIIRNLNEVKKYTKYYLVCQVISLAIAIAYFIVLSVSLENSSQTGRFSLVGSSTLVGALIIISIVCFVFWIMILIRVFNINGHNLGMYKEDLTTIKIFAGISILIPFIMAILIYVKTNSMVTSIQNDPNFSEDMGSYRDQNGQYQNKDRYHAPSRNDENKRRDE